MLISDHVYRSLVNEKCKFVKIGQYEDHIVYEYISEISEKTNNQEWYASKGFTDCSGLLKTPWTHSNEVQNDLNIKKTLDRSMELYEKICLSHFHNNQIIENLKAYAVLKNSISNENNVIAQSKSVLDIFNNNNGNLLFVGEGGIGKTTSLLMIWKDMLNENELSLYIPLNVCEVGKDNFINAYAKKIYNFDLDKTDYPVIILLDGFNEIIGSKKKILDEIKNLSLRQNTRIVITSRHGFINFHDPIVSIKTYEIQPLDESIIYKFLSDKNLPIIDGWEKLLSSPMMLMLYADICVIRKNAEVDRSFTFKPSKSKVELIYNYLICQLAKLLPMEQVANLYSAYIALFGVLPYVAWHMEKDRVLSIKAADFNSYIKDYLAKNEILKKKSK